MNCWAASKLGDAGRQLVSTYFEGFHTISTCIDYPPETKRQDDSDLGVGPSSDTVGVGPAFDGTHGVDSEDIISIPQIGFGSFQLFPDQYTYSTVVDPSLPVFNRTLMIGLDWIGRHIATGRL